MSIIFFFICAYIHIDFPRCGRLVYALQFILNKSHAAAAALLVIPSHRFTYAYNITFIKSRLYIYLLLFMYLMPTSFDILCAVHFKIKQKIAHAPHNIRQLFVPIWTIFGIFEINIENIKYLFVFKILFICQNTFLIYFFCEYEFLLF